MIKLLRPALLICGMCIAGIGYAQSTATFNYVTASNANTDPGTFAKYTNNGATDTNPGKFSVTAYGFSTTGTAVDLFNKNDGTNEVGLGIKSGVDHEIDTTHFIQLDVSALMNQGFKTLTFGFGSGQAYEGFAFYGSNALGQMGTLLYSDTNATGKTAFTGLSVTADLTANFRYYAVTALNGNGKTPQANIVLENGTAIDNTLAFGGNGGFAAVTPEGPSAALLMFGLIPVGAIVLRGRRSNRA